MVAEWSNVPYFLSYYLWRYKESFIWLEYAHLYEKDEKEIQNRPMETTSSAPEFDIFFFNID